MVTRPWHMGDMPPVSSLHIAHHPGGCQDYHGQYQRRVQAMELFSARRQLAPSPCSPCHNIGLMPCWPRGLPPLPPMVVSRSNHHLRTLSSSCLPGWFCSVLFWGFSLLGWEGGFAKLRPLPPDVPCSCSA